MPCAPRMTRCKAECRHRALVNDYRAERLRQLDVAEVESRGCATELAEFVEAHPLVTFRAWLGWLKGPTS